VEAGFKVESLPFIKRKIYLASEIRKRMIAEENWKELVPNSVATFIEEINGDARLRQLNKSDTVN
jgi:nicotinamide-nucleotide adenylyltransferase